MHKFPFILRFLLVALQTMLFRSLPTLVAQDHIGLRSDEALRAHVHLACTIISRASLVRYPTGNVLLVDSPNQGPPGVLHPEGRLARGVLCSAAGLQSLLD